MKEDAFVGDRKQPPFQPLSSLPKLQEPVNDSLSPFARFRRLFCFTFFFFEPRTPLTGRPVEYPSPGLLQFPLNCPKLPFFFFFCFSRSFARQVVALPFAACLLLPSREMRRGRLPPFCRRYPRPFFFTFCVRVPAAPPGEILKQLFPPPTEQRNGPLRRFFPKKWSRRGVTTFSRKDEACLWKYAPLRVELGGSVVAPSLV